MRTINSHPGHMHARWTVEKTEGAINIAQRNTATLGTKYRTKTERTSNTEVISGANKVLATIISYKTSTVLKKLVLVVNPFTSCWQKISKYYAFILCTKSGKREVVYFCVSSLPLFLFYFEIIPCGIFCFSFYFDFLSIFYHIVVVHMSFFQISIWRYN